MMPEFHAVVFGYPSQPPRFALRDRVLISYATHTGETVTQRGFIVGVMYNPDDYVGEGWFYVVATYQFSYESSINLPHYEYVHESELTALNS